MGKVMIIEGADFSQSPKAVNLYDLPIVTGDLIGFYTGLKSETDSNNQIVTMPSVFVNGAIFRKIPGATGSPTYPFIGTIFKGNVIRSGSSVVTPGLNAVINLNLLNGVSFTFLYWRSGNSTGSNRTILGVKGIGLQLKSNSTAGNGHLVIGSTSIDIGFHGLTASEAEAITLTINKTTIKFYRNGVLLKTEDVTSYGLPDSVEDIVSILGNWTGNSGLSGHQTKQIQIHSKVLTDAEIQNVHNNLNNLKK